MRKNLINITIVFAFVLGLFSPNTNQSVQAQENQVDNAQSDVVEVPTNRIIVKYKDGTNASVTPSLQPQMQRVSEASSWSLEYVREMSNDAHVLELPQRLSVQQVEAIAAQLETLPEVEYAEPDRIYQHLLVPNDTQFNNQWHYYDTWGINLPAAWETTTGSTDIVIAVVDTGITAHGDIDDRLVPGYDFISYDGEANDDADTSNVNERDNDPSDPGNWVTAGENASGYFAGCAITNSTWHGTHVAGTIGAESNNNSFVAGVDWNARILPVRVLGKCGGYTSDIVDGMRWAAGLTVSGVPANANPAHIINLSLGGAGACSTTEQNAITEIVNAGTVIVAAAGNNNINVSGFSPANCNGVIAVAATDEDGEKASYSNFGAGIDISAPGDGVVSLLDTGTQGPTGESYGSKSGTSMAAPHVSGVLGLMFAINPDLTPAQALTLLQDSAKAFPGGGSCTTSNCGAGIVDAVAAVNLTELPDLIITNVTLNPAEPVSGQPFDVLVTVKNQGGSTSESLVYRDVWVDRDPSTFIDPNTNCPIDSQEYESDYLREDFNASIPPGVSETLAVIIDNPPLTGSHQLWVYVDATCITAEGIEDNNGYGPINIGIAGFPDSWAGGVSIQSDQPVVSVGRPHIGAEIASYGGSSTGSLNSYIPMLFKAAFGGSYNSAFYVQNTNSTNTTNITIKYYSTAGVLNCTKSDTIAPLASKGYWVPTATCDTGSLPAGWVGGVIVTSDQPVVSVGRPHIGAQVMTYKGFSTGSLNSYIPMLFKGAFGGSYDSAFYVQNTSSIDIASITIKYYSTAGVLNCTKSDTIAPLASKGYWVPTATCDTGSLPAGWVGGVIVTSDQPVVSVGRPHIGTQVTTYNGFSTGSLNSYIPMLFKGAFGGSYDSAFYVQNTSSIDIASITIKYYSTAGVLNCTKSDTIAPLASKGYWVPTATCDTGSLPAGWAGAVVVTSNQSIVTVGRPHIGTEITTYDGFNSGATSYFLPMLFRNAFGGSYHSAVYVQNTNPTTTANVVIKFYSSDGVLNCILSDNIPANSTKGYWLPSLTCN